MSLNTSLSTLRTMLKALLGDSLSVGTQSDALYTQLLADKQQWLVGEYDFPFLKKRWNKAIVDGDRYLAIPTVTVDGVTANIDFARPFKAFVTYTSSWMEVEYGINEEEEMNSQNPETGITGWDQVKNSPIQRWQFKDSTNFEIWPVSNTAQTFRFVGQRTLSALAADGDLALIDDQLLVLSTAVDLLTKSKEADAPARVAEAKERLSRIRSSMPTRSRDIVIGGAMRDRTWRRRVKIIGV